MLSKTVLFSLLIFTLAQVAFIGSFVNATGNFEASSSRHTVQSDRKPPLIPTQETERKPYRFVFRPPIQIPAVSQYTSSDEPIAVARTRLADRLGEYNRDPRTVKIVGLGMKYPETYRQRLRELLQRSLNHKKALFLDVTPDRQGRILGVPLFSNEERFGWALLGVHPAQNNRPPRIELYSFAEHRERNAKDFMQRLTGSADTLTLKTSLIRRL